MPAEMPLSVSSAWRSANSLAGLMPLYARIPPAYEPGTRYIYSDLGYYPLGRLIEVASGKTYDRFLDERVLSPLGMTDSSLLPQADKLHRFASVHQKRDGGLSRATFYDVPAVSKLSFARPAWSLFSTAADLGTFYQVLLDGGVFRGRRILSRASVQLMTTVQTGDFADDLSGRRVDYGFGLNIIGGPQPSHLAAYLPPVFSPGSYGHGGLLGTLGWVDPAKSLVAVYLVQRAPTDPVDAFRREDRNAFIELVGSVFATR